MSKRMTETTKWNDAWFIELPLTAKLLWIYLLDNCSLSGVFDISYRMLNFILESKDIDRDYINNHFSNRVQWLNDNQFIINSFIRFQYKDGNLNPDYNPHKAVFKDLAKHNLTLEQVLTKSYVSLREELQGKGKVQGKVQGKEKSVVGKKKVEKSKDSTLQKPDDVSLQVWEDFLKHRKLKKATVTETVIKTFRKEAEKAKITLDEALSVCVSSGWVGFRADWFKKSNGKQSLMQKANARETDKLLF